MCSRKILQGNPPPGEEFSNCLFPMRFQTNKQINKPQIQAERKTKMWTIFQSYFIIWISIFYFCSMYKYCFYNWHIFYEISKSCKTSLSTQVLGWLELNINTIWEKEIRDKKKKKKPRGKLFLFYFLNSMWQDLGKYVNACVCEEEALWAGSEYQTTPRSARELLLYSIRLLYGKGKILWCWKLFIPSAQLSSILAVILSRK